jgi:hypothetical protein
MILNTEIIKSWFPGIVSFSIEKLRSFIGGSISKFVLDLANKDRRDSD